MRGVLTTDIRLEKESEYSWRIPPFGGMRVPGRIFANEKLLEHAREEKALEQVCNVAHLPGIVKASLAMPDIHWGYGFAIGGVAAFDLEEGIISPGGVGYDIACGVRLLRTDLTFQETRGKIEPLAHEISRTVPSGVGRGGKITAGHKELQDIFTEGAGWAVINGFGAEEDLNHIENYGKIEGANPDKVSKRAYERGLHQAGTLGSGNHFLELQVVEEIFHPKAADRMGIFQGQLCCMIHCGSRGVGHQICSDYVKTLGSALVKYGIELPDRQLACAPIKSLEAQDYYAAMIAAANFALNNRQVIGALVRDVFERVLGRPWRELGMGLVFDVSHNLAKFEEHDVDGQKKELCVHRKGATRSFPAGHPAIPEDYRDIGQPVIIPGDMGRASFMLVGAPPAMEQSWGSACHGAGRVMSRAQAKRTVRGSDLRKELEAKGIVVRAPSGAGLAEEAPIAYKDVSEVVEVVHRAGLAHKVARLRPVGVIKGT